MDFDTMYPFLHSPTLQPSGNSDDTNWQEFDQLLADLDPQEKAMWDLPTVGDPEPSLTATATSGVDSQLALPSWEDFFNDNNTTIQYDQPTPPLVHDDISLPSPTGTTTVALSSHEASGSQACSIQGDSVQHTPPLVHDNISLPSSTPPVHGNLSFQSPAGAATVALSSHEASFLQVNFVQPTPPLVHDNINLPSSTPVHGNLSFQSPTGAATVALSSHQASFLQGNFVQPTPPLVHDNISFPSSTPPVHGNLSFQSPTGTATVALSSHQASSLHGNSVQGNFVQPTPPLVHDNISFPSSTPPVHGNQSFQSPTGTATVAPSPHEASGSQARSYQGNSLQSNSVQGNSIQGNSGQGNSGQGNSGQGNSGQGNLGQGNSGQGNSGQSSIFPNLSNYDLNNNACLRGAVSELRRSRAPRASPAGSSQQRKRPLASVSPESHEDEEARREKARERNRDAAQRCRDKKKKDEEDRRKQLSRLEKKRVFLNNQIASLRKQVFDLKALIVHHGYCRHPEIDRYINEMIQKLKEDFKQQDQRNVPNQWTSAPSNGQVHNMDIGFGPHVPAA